MNSKSKKIIIAAVAVIVAAVLCAVVFFGDNGRKSGNTELNETSTAAWQESDGIPEYYKEIIAQYQDVVVHDYYRDVDGDRLYAYLGKYAPYVYSDIEEERNSYKFYYALHDIDKNGIPELITANVCESGYKPWEVFTYADGRIRMLMAEDFLYAPDVTILANSVIMTYSNMEDGGDVSEEWNFYRYGDDGATPEWIGALNKIKYSENGETKFYDAKARLSYDTDFVEIDKEKFESMMKEYIGDAPRTIDYETAGHENTDIKFDWKIIDENTLPMKAENEVSENPAIAKLAKEDIIKIFTDANKFYDGWLCHGWVVKLDQTDKFEYDENEYARVASEEFKSVNDIKDEADKYFVVSTYIDHLNSYYKMHDGKLYGISSLGEGGDYLPESLSLNIITLEDNYCKFSVTSNYDEGEPYSAEYTMVKRDGNWIFTGWFEENIALYKNENIAWK
ncbi:MAG: hypothetical protein NC122_10190 [Faecalibacterium sp.]|nr:hypothetical protein [Ruminococcus sp.]MCM1393027.1 hypothetical protein [Ruminococcus sp.]MCM1486560.1 hypothetical protein [Faecalibacterium sp.]